MKILVACEFSGIVREAFRARGHDAISCDLLDTELPGPHIVGDVEAELRKRWDMVLAFPPCTYLSYAGTAHWNKPGRAEKREDAMRFFMACYNANATKVCVENPFGLPCQAFRPPNQIVNPFDFGERVRKRTCLWLRGLPILTRGDELWPRTQAPVDPPEPIYSYIPGPSYKGSRRIKHAHHTEAIARIRPKQDRRRERSRTFMSIAAAMAEQWG